MNITQEGEEQYFASLNPMKKPWVCKCLVCGNLLLNWVGSTHCCGSLAEIIAEGKDEVEFLGFKTEDDDQ